jgi:hypothetical protein
MPKKTYLPKGYKSDPLFAYMRRKGSKPEPEHNHDRDDSRREALSPTKSRKLPNDNDVISASEGITYPGEAKSRARRVYQAKRKSFK